MKYLFILGRNPELSVAEILSYLEKIGNKVVDFSVVNNGMLLEVRQKINPLLVKNLGGTISIGEIISKGKSEGILNELEKKELYSGTKNNFNYCVWDFGENEFYDEIVEYLKQRFRSEKLKPTLKNLTGSLDLQSGERVFISGSDLIDIEFFVFSDENEDYFGKIISKTNFKEIEKRDIEKPVRREALAISPRLAKIMINLSLVEENEILVDPFCGIGVVLQEALLQDIKVIGIDKDKTAIEGAAQNLKWAKFNPKSYTLINNDSSKVSIPKANVIVSEPDLGQILKKMPTKERAKDILNYYENLIIKVINNLKGKISGRIVLTAPFILVNKNERIGADFVKIAEKTQFTINEYFPIADYRKNQIVGRQIIVLQK